MNGNIYYYWNKSNPLTPVGNAPPFDFAVVAGLLKPVIPLDKGFKCAKSVLGFIIGFPPNASENGSDEFWLLAWNVDGNAEGNAAELLVENDDPPPVLNDVGKAEGKEDPQPSPIDPKPEPFEPPNDEGNVEFCENTSETYGFCFGCVDCFCSGILKASKGLLEDIFVFVSGIKTPPLNMSSFTGFDVNTSSSPLDLDFPMPENGSALLPPKSSNGSFSFLVIFGKFLPNSSKPKGSDSAFFFKGWSNSNPNASSLGFVDVSFNIK